MTEVCSTIEEGLGHLISHVEADPRVGSDSCRALVDLTAALTTVKTFLRWLGVKSPGACAFTLSKSRFVTDSAVPVF